MDKNDPTNFATTPRSSNPDYQVVQSPDGKRLIRKITVTTRTRTVSGAPKKEEQPLKKESAKKTTQKEESTKVDKKKVAPKEKKEEEKKPVLTRAEAIKDKETSKKNHVAMYPADGYEWADTNPENNATKKKGETLTTIPTVTRQDVINDTDGSKTHVVIKPEKGYVFVDEKDPNNYATKPEELPKPGVHKEIKPGVNGTDANGNKIDTPKDYTEVADADLPEPLKLFEKACDKSIYPYNFCKKGDQFFVQWGTEKKMLPIADENTDPADGEAFSIHKPDNKYYYEIGIFKDTILEGKGITIWQDGTRYE